MPSDAWEEGPRFRPSARAILLIPVAISFLVQVPATAAVAWWQHVAPLEAAVSIALAAASALALLAARRWPGPTVVAVSALALADLFVPPDGGPPFVALAFAIIGAVVRGARVWALTAVGVAWLVAIATAGFQDVTWHPFRIALTTLGLAVCFAIGAGIRARVVTASTRRAQLAERRRVAEQEERARIARELHDVLAHSLSQIAVQSGMGLHLFDRDPERAREALANIRGLSATGLDEVRGVLGFLRGDDPAATSAPLTPTPQLADLAALVSARNGLGLAVTLDDRLGGDVPPSAVQSTAYRIAQEALTNVVRHSAAAAATVTLRRDGAALVLTVRDDGTGVAPDAAPGGGMRGMRERAELLGGSVDINAATPGGTILEARLPWDAEDHRTAATGSAR